MKKTYETPSVEVIEFKYRDQVVVASGGRCEVSGSYRQWADTCSKEDASTEYHN